MGPGRRNRIFFALMILLVVGLGAAPMTSAGEEPPAEHPGEESGTHEGGFHPNHFAGIIGWSYKDSGQSAVSFGMEYSRYFTRRISLAVYLEMSAGDFDADTYGLAVGGMVTENLQLFAGPGIERTLFEENEVLARVGLDYVFHPKGLSVAPIAWIDFVDGHEIYFLGVAIGTGF